MIRCARYFSPTLLFFAACGSSESTAPQDVPDALVDAALEASPLVDSAPAMDAAPDVALDSPPSSPDPGLPGPCAVATLGIKVTSTLDGYQIPIKLYLPSDSSTPQPVVLVLHGNQIPINSYAKTAEHLASWCYVVAVDDYRHALLPATPDDTCVQDVLDVLAWVRAEGTSALQGKVDPVRAAFVGHSAGGRYAFETVGKHPGIVDAIVGFDAVQGHEGNFDDAMLKKIDAPALVLGETYSGEHGVVGQMCAPLAANYQQFYERLSPGLPSVEVTFLRAYHMSWLDSQDCGTACLACPENPNPDHAAVLQKSLRYTTAWLESHVRAKPEFDRWVTGSAMDDDVKAGIVTWRSK